MLAHFIAFLNSTTSIKNSLDATTITEKTNYRPSSTFHGARRFGPKVREGREISNNPQVHLAHKFTIIPFSL